MAKCMRCGRSIGTGEVTVRLEPALLVFCTDVEECRSERGTFRARQSAEEYRSSRRKQRGAGARPRGGDIGGLFGD